VPSNAIQAEHVRAASALTALQQLTRLSIHARSDGEVVALAGLTQLQHLWMSLSECCSLHFWMQLGAMQKLRLLQLQVPVACFDEVGERVTAVSALLSSLKRVARFELSIAENKFSDGLDVKEDFDDAREWLDECGLGSPVEMLVVSIDRHSPPRD
jgi:hypothetical protein